MNKLVLTSLVAALSGMFAAPQTATAGGNEVAAAFGGFIGGVIVGSSVNRDRDRGYDDDVRVRGRIEIGSRDRHRRDGNWEWTRVRVWVPGQWVVTHNRRGDRVRYFERGRYEWRRERVWVSHREGRHPYHR